MRHSVIGWVAGVLALSASSNAGAPFEVVEVSNLGGHGDNFAAYAISNSGTVAGRWIRPDGEVVAALWSETEGLIDLGDFGGASATAFGVNGAGQAAIARRTVDGNWDRALRWTPGVNGGTILEVAPYAAPFTLARAISDSGSVAGTSGGTPFLYTDENALVELKSADGEQALGMNDLHQVVGTDFAYTPGEGASELSNTIGEPGLKGLIDAWDINNSGRIAAYAFLGSPPFLGFVIDLAADGSIVHEVPYGELKGVNEAGWVVGGSITMLGVPSVPILWTEHTGAVPLNPLLPEGVGPLVDAWAINDYGVVVVQGGDFIYVDGVFMPYTRLLRITRTCPYDLDWDGDVDGLDLAYLLSAWGSCDASGLACEADVDFSGAVDGVDLAELLVAWGACP